MSVKVELKVERKNLAVNVPEDFAIFLHKQMEKDFNLESNNDIKKLFQAYVLKTHELYIQEENIQEILQECENL